MPSCVHSVLRNTEKRDATVEARIAEYGQRAAELRVRKDIREEAAEKSF